MEEDKPYTDFDLLIPFHSDEVGDDGDVGDVGDDGDGDDGDE